jgi:hypothetical protein
MAALLAVVGIPRCGPAAVRTVMVSDYGAVADGKTNDSDAFTRAIEAVAGAGGGTVVVPAGEYLLGPIRLRSHITLQLEAGALLKASARLEDYPREAGTVWGESGRPGLITVSDAQDVAIIGRGVIDGNGMAFVFPDKWKPLGSVGSRRFTRQGEDFMHPRFGTEHGPLAHGGDRPGNLLRLINCTNVLLNGITIQNSPTWTIQVNGCTDVKIHALSINSRGSGLRVPNDDGIDLVNSRRVNISDCDIRTGDDCIALFGSQQVTVTGCTLQSRSAAVRAGYNSGLTRHCVFNNLAIHDSNRGLLVNVRGEGSVEDILFNNIVMTTRLYTGDWRGKGEPIHVSAVPMSAGRPLGSIRNVRFENIAAESEAGIVIYGSEQSRIQDVSLCDVRLTIRNSPLRGSYGGNFDLRSTDRDDRALFKHDIPALYAGHVDRLDVRGFQVQWEDGLPDFFTHAIQCEDFADLDITAFRGRQAGGSGVSAAIALARGREVRIRDCVAGSGTGLFVRLEDVGGGLLAGNDLAGAKAVCLPEKPALEVSGNRLP